VCVCVFVYMIILIVSSSYLLVFGNDRVRDTQEHMMLQVDLVRHKVGAGARLEGFFTRFYYVFE